MFCFISTAFPLNKNSSRDPRAADSNIIVRPSLLSISEVQGLCQLGYDLLQQEEKFSIKVLGNSAVSMEGGWGGEGTLEYSFLDGRRTEWKSISSQSTQAEFRPWSVNKISSRRFSNCSIHTCYYLKCLSCKIKITVETEEKSTSEEFTACVADLGNC